MSWLSYTDGTYRTRERPPGPAARICPSLMFYGGFLAIVTRANRLAVRGDYDAHELNKSALACLRRLERVGLRIEISGIGNIRDPDSPCVIVANHMSTLETTILPVIVQPFRPVTFIVKQSLLTFPLFGPIMRSLDPIPVTRTNPRHDLKTVLEGGVRRLRKGVSIIVFPQTTRTLVFDPARFTTLGVKLAQRAGVPVVPLALLTDAWGNGKLLKEFGRIDPARDVRFAFGEPLHVTGRGGEEHQQVIRFIRGKLDAWGRERARDGRLPPATDPEQAEESPTGKEPA